MPGNNLRDLVYPGFLENCKCHVSLVLLPSVHVCVEHEVFVLFFFFLSDGEGLLASSPSVSPLMSSNCFSKTCEQPKYLKKKKKKATGRIGFTGQQ